MGRGVIPADKKVTLTDKLLIALRRYLKKYRLISLVRFLRLLLHFGPWRKIPQSLIRQIRRPVRSLDENVTSLLVAVDVKDVAEELRENSVAIAGVLSSEFVNRLRSVTDHLPVDDYQLMHYIDDNVRLLSEDPILKSVLREYLNCEPVLLESTIVVTGSHKSHRMSEQNKFHFDYAGWESLNVFVYLTDVTADSSCHIVAKGSHRNIGLRDILRGTLTDDEALRRFGSSIQNITGPAGTLFFENTEAYHRRFPGDERRVMLNMLYASHRNWLCRGRTSHKHIEKRAQRYHQLKPGSLQPVPKFQN